MKKYYILIAVLCAVLVLLIGGSILLNKKLDEDPTILNDYIDSDKLDLYSKSNKKTSSKKTTSLTEMSVTSKEEKIKDISKLSNEHEIIVTDIGEIRVEALLSDAEWKDRLELGFNQENINNANKECSGLYYYDNIDKSLKQLYLEIYLALKNHTESFYICSTKPNDIDKAFNCVMADHPLIFYSNGYMYTKYTDQDKIVKIEFIPAYTMTKDQAEKEMVRVEEYREAFLKGIKMSEDEYTKIKYTYEFIIMNTEYDVNAPENQNILSVFKYGKSVCQGYAKAFQYLAESLGIQSTLVVGYVGDNEGHAWNMVKCRGQYYYIDCTWGDSSYLENTQSTSGIEGINYDYLNITTSELEKTHKIDNFDIVPKCTSTSDNYYVKEGLYFKDINLNQLAGAFDKAKMLGRKSVEIKCADAIVFKHMHDYLLTDNHVFDYLPADTESINYMTNDDMYIYSFPLK